MALNDVFPRNNLPASSVPWGRKVEESVRSNAYGIFDLDLAVSSENRVNAAQMGVIGRQIETLGNQNQAISDQLGLIEDENTRITGILAELAGRTSQSQTVTNFSFTPGSGGGGYTSQSRTVQLPAPVGGQRTALVSVSGTVSTSIAGASMFIRITSGGVVKVGDTLPMPTGDSPSGWTNRYSTSFATFVGTGTTPVVITVYGFRFSGSGGNVQFNNVSIDSMYGDLV